MTSLPDYREVEDLIGQGHRLYADPLALFPDGTVLAIGKETYRVRGRKQSYVVTLLPQASCECPDWEHRQSKATGALCRHQEVLLASIELGACPCPWCKGPGCYRCQGTGRATIQQYAAGQEDQAALAATADRRLRAVFEEIR